MANTFTLYNDGKQNLGKAMNAETDTFKVSLHLAAYTPDIDAHTTFSDLTNELAASGNYTAGGETVTTNVWLADDTNDRAYFDCDDIAWAALTQSGAIKYAVLYNITDSSNLLGYWTFGTAQEPNGSTFTIQPQAPGNGGVFYI